MGKRVTSLLAILLLYGNLFAQQDFSLSKYFVANPRVGEAVCYNQPGDMIKIENYVKSLIATGNFDFPDIYGSNLTPNINQWATYPDSILWNVYYAYVAFSIYIDYSNRVPWKLADLTSEQANDFFFNGNFFYSSVQNFGERSTPTNPLFTYSFLIEKNLIGSTRQETIERLIQWSRYRLRHFTGAPSPANNFDHWQHNGGPPVERVISGTTQISNGLFSHWSMGCWGAQKFFENVLRIINVPVRLERIGNHAAMDFPTENLIMTHGDDLYGLLDELNDFEIHAKEILIPYAEIDSIMAVGFEGNEIVAYSYGKLMAKFFPIATWLFRPNDTTYMYNIVSAYVQFYTRSDTTEQYHQIMNQARARYSAVDIDYYNEISSHFSSDSLWYKIVYGLNPQAYLDTVLIPYNIGYAEIVDDSIILNVDETTNEVSPVFFRNADSFISIEPDSIINLNNYNEVTITAEDSVLAVTYPIIKNTRPRYSVTLAVTPEGGGECAGDGFFLQGTNATIVAAPATGFNFVKWTEEDTLVSDNSPYTFIVENNRSFVAHFDTIQYTITAIIEPEIGGAVLGAGIYKHGRTVELTAIPAEGYYFVAWKNNQHYISYEPTISFIADRDTTIIAEFGIHWYYVGIWAHPPEAGTLDGEGLYPHGTQVTVTATPLDDWVFINWVKYTDEGPDTVSVNPVYSFILETSFSLVANFGKEYNISVTANPEEGGIVTGAGTYFSFTEATITATPNEGFRFVNYTDKEQPEWLWWWQEYNIYVEEDRNLTANFEKLTYSIYANPSNFDAGTVSGSGIYEFGELVELTAIPHYDYAFVNWMEDDTEVSTNQTYTFTANTNRSLVANFSPISSVIISENDYLKLNIFPNPARDVINLRLSSSGSYSELPIKVYLVNAVGQLVMEEKFFSPEGVVAISVSKIPAGIYSIDVWINNISIGRGKVIIIK